jgi:hypothetical protein
VVPRLAPFALLLAGCAAGPVAGPSDPDRCVALFQTYDRIKATMSTPSGRSDRMVIPRDLQPPVQDLQEAGCLTLSAGLDFSVTAPPVVDGGAAITPTGVHAGIVTNMGDEAAALAFFAAQGIEARSIGAAGLGRRIYLGPFATQGALDGAMALARAAGFASPYPADF